MWMFKKMVRGFWPHESPGLPAPGDPEIFLGKVGISQICQIIFFAMNITNGRWWFNAARSLWRSGHLLNR
jgi:hypothetical protein